jgi:hypothetical protein
MQTRPCQKVAASVMDTSVGGSGIWLCRSDSQVAGTNPLPGRLMIARPSLLIGDREALGQPERPLEKVSAATRK